MKTDPVDTDKLRELLAKATPGPWVLELMHTSAHIHQKDGLHWLGSCVVGHGDWHNPKESRGAKDASLIVAAINSLPALLDEIDRLRGIVEASRTEVGSSS